MKLHLEVSSSNAVTAYDGLYIEVNHVRHAHAVWFAAQGGVSAWTAATPQDLNGAQFDPVLALRPEIVLLGTGARQIFPSRDLQLALHQRGVGFECMDTPAACRTFNLLVSEGRHVAAALFLPGAHFPPEPDRRTAS